MRAVIWLVDKSRVTKNRRQDRYLLMSISDNSERIITKTKLTRLESHGKVINVTKVSLSLIVSKRMIFKVKFLILRILVRVNASGNRERINDKNKIKESLETA